jgi:hypothetical protein
MIRPRHWVVLATLLTLTGIGIAIWKAQVYGYPLSADQTEDAWSVQARLQLRPDDGPISVTLRLPAAAPGLARLQEDFIGRGFGLDVQETQYRRTATWAIRRTSGLQTLYYRAQFYRDVNQRDFAPAPAYPPVPQLEEPFATAMASIVDEVRQRSANIATFTAEVLARINSASPSAEMRLFLNAPDYAGDRLAIARTLLAGARIPTETINGLLLIDSDRRASPARWLAVHNDQQWLYFDPQTGRNALPDNLLIWWLGNDPAVTVFGAELTQIEWSVRRNEIGSLALAQQRARDDRFMLASASLLDLPVHTQSVYAVLLLVPVGAFVLVLMRNVVGVRAFGTFMPVLIALAFRETGLIGGLVLFTLVVAVGLSFRFYLERLRLMLVPRLTAVVTIVVILMVGLSMISARVGWEVGLSVGLFPMVILAMVIERMSIIWEERGAHDALLEGAGSALIATLAYLAMGLDLVQYLVIVYPELLLVILGATIMLGRYSGYRLSELVRFRDLVPNQGSAR